MHRGEKTDREGESKERWGVRKRREKAGGSKGGKQWSTKVHRIQDDEREPTEIRARTVRALTQYGTPVPLVTLNSHPIGSGWCEKARRRLVR